MKRYMTLLLVLLLVITACGKDATSEDASQQDSAPVSDETQAADNSTDAEGDVIKVAFIGNTTGDYQQYGIPVRNSMALWFDQLNADGGINGKKVELLEYDDKADGIEAINSYNLAKEDGATAILGSVMTGPTIALADSTFEDNIPQMTASATAAGVTLIDPEAETPEVRANVFRSCFTDPYQGEKMAMYAKEKLGAQKVAVLFENGSDYSEGVKDKFIATAEANGMEVVASESFSTGDKDFRAQMTKITAAEPDAILLPIYYGEAGLAITAARGAGFTGVLMGCDGWGSVKDYADAKDLEGSVYCSGYAPGTEATKPFEEAYKKAYASDVPNMFAPLGYDAAMLMTEGLKAAEAAGLTPNTPEYYQAVIDGIKALKDVKGITGSYQFDDQNNPIKEAAIIELKDGQEVFKEMY
ncbi:MAG: ABC transporter substrate-binding protein [Peptoniphilaceae bacterium]|nr:ABC transporter substrate-binding protein [Peptoniphilaceae bacterium]MDY6085342.1 ABC transporter substrate-binding protein [Peptoniphilaceae bacterium]